ncbi:MAG TPA: glycosyltransferase [Pyrinomonadaceae bacterium]|nr:glycosyltransferase [Pyrinomonadaceae bacterium]
MSEPPKVSVTIPSYNHAEYLPAAIESVIGQTYRPLELIIVDDGSTDGSLEIAKDYAHRYPDIIRVGTHPKHANKGISDTVNLCFQLTTGEYWMGLPSDDILHPRKVADQVAFLEKRPELGWVYSYAVVVDGSGHFVPELGVLGTDITRSSDVVARLIMSNTIYGMTVLMRRSAAADIAPHDTTLVYSDWDFWLRLAARHRPGFLARTHLFYRAHDKNTSIGIDFNVALRRTIEVIAKLREQGPCSGDVFARPRVKALLDLQQTYFYFLVDDRSSARKYLNAAFETDPALSSDVPYFRRWLKGSFLEIASRRVATALDFHTWIMAQLPIATRNTDLAKAMGTKLHGLAFTRWAIAYHAYARALEPRKRVFRCLLNDPTILRDRVLLPLYAKILIGPGIVRRVRNIFHWGRALNR